MAALRVALLGSLALWTAADAAVAAVVLEKVAQVPGLAAGEILTAWERRAPNAPASALPLASGPLDHPFDLALLVVEEVPCGGVRVLVGGRWVEIPRTASDLAAAPALEGAAATAYRAARRRRDEKDPGAQADAATALAALANASAPGRTAAWLSLEAAWASRAANDPDRAAAAFESAARDPALAAAERALVHLERARFLYQRNQPAAALAAARDGLSELDGAANWPMLRAELTFEIAAARLPLGETHQADELFAGVIDTVRALAPDGVLEARAWQNRGIIAVLTGRLPEAERALARALALNREHSRPIDRALNSLAIVAKARGDLASAENLYLRAIDSVAGEAGVVAMYRGNLGNLYLVRGENERARALLRQLVDHYRQQEPESVFALSAALGNLATAELRLGDHAAAEEHVRQALAIKEERSPQSVGIITTLNVLGAVLEARERWADAAATYRRALEIAARAAPRSTSAADTHGALGGLALKTGDLAAARAEYDQALTLQRAIVSGTRNEAQWLHALGRVAAARNLPEQALARWLEAVDLLDGLRGRLGGGLEASAGFSSLHHELYWSPLDGLATQGRIAEAHLLAERFRAQAFLAMLARRDLDLSADLPPELDGERRRLAALYDATLLRLGTSGGPADGPERSKQRSDLDRIRLDQQEVEARIVAASPRLGALRNPRPLDAAGALALLPPKALLLTFALGPDHSWAFALGPDGQALSATRLPVGFGALADGVRSYRALIDDPGSRGEARLAIEGERLSKALLEPFADRLAVADHLIVVPDGPLHLLPWSALPDPAGGGEPLVARRAISLAPSVTALRDLLQRGVAASPRQHLFVAFGDPLPAAAPAPGASDAARARDTRLRADSLAPLTSSRREVTDIAALFGAGALTFLGDQSSEARVLEHAPRARRLHFACHALVDSELPLESGLVLSPPPAGLAVDEGSRPESALTENGFLQVWEIYQRLRLDADLVTLSACETGLGQELRGEGVLGLTRAFHFVGARTVVSSLWQVSDEATASLMTVFYEHLVGGASKAEALRRAQLAVRRAPGSDAFARPRHPFYWAAFQVNGAWD